MKKRILALFLALMMCVPLVACKKDKDDNVDTNSIDTNQGGNAGFVYEYPELDFGGKEFTFLNPPEDTWAMHTGIVFEEPNGIALDEAIYKRNLALEQRYKVKFTVVNELMSQHATYLQQQIASGGDEIDAAFVGGNYVASLIGDGAVVDLNSIDTMNMDMEWWDQNILEASKLGNSTKTYYAISDISFTGFDLTWSVMFNPEILSQHQLEKPYELVKSGEWTFEKMFEMAAACQELNGAEDYTYQYGGKQIYGVTTYWNFVSAAMAGYGISMTQKNEQGVHVNTLIDNQKFYDFAEDYGLKAREGGLYLGLNKPKPDQYDEVFKSGRAAFVGCEIKSTTLFKEMNDYGVVPVPKGDSTQQSYYSYVNHSTPLLVIPKTNVNLNETGIILDAMAYMSHDEVLPVYYETTLSLKNMKDQESIAMLDIIRDSRVFEVSLIYGWTTKMYDELCKEIDVGNYSVASIVKSYESTVKSSITATYKQMNT